MEGIGRAEGTFLGVLTGTLRVLCHSGMAKISRDRDPQFLRQPPIVTSDTCCCLIISHGCCWEQTGGHREDRTGSHLF
jgi:hypothetical protein